MLLFSSPYWLLALLFIPLWFIVRGLRKREEYPVIQHSDIEGLKLATAHRRRRWPGYVEFAMHVSLVAVILALARPQIPLKSSLDHHEGIDIIITMDISLSMLARDFQPDRLEASKDVAARFINDRGPDRIGLVVFAGQSFTMCPITADKAALITLLQQVQAGFIEDGSTAIGDGIATAINRLKDSDAKSKVIILLTDGENNAGNIDPLQAAEIAALFGIRLYTIGVGSRGTAIGPVQIIGGNIIFGPVEVDLDEGTLKKAAEIAGGRYFRALDEHALMEIYKEIDMLEKSRLQVTTHHTRMELFPYLLALALIIIASGWLIRFIFVKTVP